MKKIIGGICTLAIISASALALVACNPAKAPQPQNVTASTKDMLAASIASAGQFIPASSSGKSAAEKTDEQIVDSINQAIEAVESYIGTNPTDCVVEQTSDKAEYNNLMTITKRDLAGNVETFKLYYNQVDKTAGNTIEDQNEKDIETEQEFKLKGIMVAADGTEYEMIGEKESETSVEEDGTTETESEFKAQIFFDKLDHNDNYMIFKQEIEVEGTEIEEEFVYTIKTNGVTNTFAVEIENENGEQEVDYIDTATQTKIKFEKNVALNGSKVEMDIKYVVGTTVLNAKLTIEFSENATQKIETRTYVINGKSIVKQNAVDKAPVTP